MALAACNTPAAPPPSVAKPASPAAVRAREAMARSDWKAAAPLFREAIATAPSDVSLHYELAVVATHLDDRDEATRQFRWVLAHAAPDSMEYRAARSWLDESRAATTPASTPTSPTPERRAVLDVDRTGSSGLYGQVSWSTDPGGPHSTKRMQVHLTGLPDSPTADQRYTVRTDEEGRYEFKRIVSGPYKLTNRVAGKPTWRLRVEVETGRDIGLDLHPGNSIAVRDDFPEPGR
jgi:hypothetical protein